MGNLTSGNEFGANKVKPLIPIKIAIVGDTKVGKTALSTKYVEDIFEKNPKNQSSSNVKSKLYPLNHSNANLQIYDLSANNHFTASQQLEGARAVIFVFDLMQKQSLLSIKKWYIDTRKHNKTFKSILVGTKYDLFQQMNDLYKLEITKIARNYANNMCSPFIMCSSKLSIHIKQVFILTVDCIFGMEFTLKQKYNEKIEAVLEYDGYIKQIRLLQERKVKIKINDISSSDSDNMELNDMKQTETEIDEYECKTLLQPTNHLNRLIKIHEIDDIKDMIESDDDCDHNIDHHNDYDGYLYDNIDNDDVKEIKTFLIDTKKNIENEIFNQGLNDEDDVKYDKLQNGITMMGMMTDNGEDGDYDNDNNHDNDDDDDDDDEGMIKLEKHETLMGYTQQNDSDVDDIDNEIQIKQKGITLMGDVNITSNDDDNDEDIDDEDDNDNDSDDEKIIDSNNITLMGIGQNKKIKFIEQKQ